MEQLETIEGPGGSSFTGLSGSSFYTASRAMLLPGLATQLTGKAVREDLGWLMTVPNRHQLAWHVVEDAAGIGAMQGMARFAANGHLNAPGPVSPHVYWWNGTGYEQLTHMAEDKVSIRPSPAFQAVLASLLPAGQES